MYPSILGLQWCTCWVKWIEPTRDPIWVDQQNMEGGQLCSKWRRRRRRGTEANSESIIDVPQRPSKVLMYSTRQIDWANQQVKQSLSAIVWNGSDLEELDGEEVGEEKKGKEGEEQQIESQWCMYPTVFEPVHCTQRAKSTDDTSDWIRAHLEKFKRGLPWSLEKQKSSKSRTNNQCILASGPHVDVLNQKDRLSLQSCKSVLIWKSSNGVCLGHWRSNRAEYPTLLIDVW